MNKVRIEPMPLRILKFQKYLHKCTINTLTNREALGLLLMVLTDIEYKSVNNNQKWAAPIDPSTSPVLPTASAEGASTRLTSEKYTE